MATLDKRSSGYRIIFYYQNQRYQHPLKTTDKREAGQLKAQLERNLDLLHQGAIQPPEGADLPVFLLSGGKASELPKARKSLSLGRMLKDYRKESMVGKEANTRYTERIHVKHLLRHFGRRASVTTIPDRLQEYVNKRSEAGISHVTIKKELGTLTSVWNKWAMPRKLVALPLTLRNLTYPKKREKPPFQTWEQIERKILRGKLTREEQEEQWDALFLTVPQVDELLAFVEENGCLIRKTRRVFPWVLPMLAFCAYTGARRSEILRSRLEDLDIDGSEITIREKKKERDKEFTLRRVPLVPQLSAILQDWLKVHPGGPVTFCKEPGEPLTEQMATHYLRWALDGSKWEVVKGFHVFRHSLISNMVSRGVPERVLMAVAGHLDPETSRRYQHLLPSTVQDAMRVVFGH